MTAKMEIPSRHDAIGGGLPSIYIERGGSSRDFGHYSRSGFSSRFSPTLPTIPMSIPGQDSQMDVPPPLPPPRFVPDLNERSDHVRDHGRHEKRSIADSLDDGTSWREDGPDYNPRDRYAAIKAERDEGYASLSTISSTRSPRDSLSGGFGMSHDRFVKFRGSVDSYDRSYDSSMLDKFNTRRGPERSPPRRTGPSSYSMADSAPTKHTERYTPSLPTLSLPTRMKQGSLIDSPNRFTDTPLSSAVSPHMIPFSRALDYRSPASTDAGDMERSPIPRSRRVDSISAHDAEMPVSLHSHKQEAGSDDNDFPMEETSRLRGIQLEERGESHMAGQKRRASSPAGEEPPPSLATDMMRRRENGASRGSPTPRLTVVPQGSISSVSSAGRSGSYTAMTMTTSSLTSMSSASFGRRSPGALSPGDMSPSDSTSCASPFATAVSITTSPRSTLSRTILVGQPSQPRSATSEHQQSALQGVGSTPRANTLISPRKLTDQPPKRSGVAKMQGFLMCDCCPKKPKKFESEEELRAHELEKQYECAFCGSRFKNKNEAERHQNSLHVRRHSWSCSALTGYERAFHDSTSHPGEADTCGYCGDEFPRSGQMGAGSPRFITDADWDERVHHLQDTHKFRECNSGKKFFRADHFRQHLKHSHAGTSGKWTNMLENACMLEEEPPLPVR